VDGSIDAGIGVVFAEQHLMFVITAVTVLHYRRMALLVPCLVPMGVSILYKEFNKGIGNVKFISMVVAVTIMVQAVVMMIDVQYYGRWVSPNL
jgi:hypothetical protein